MKADPSAQALLLDLQAVDLDIDRNRHRLVVLPQRDRVTALGAQLQELNEERIVLDTEITDLRREVARADADVASVRARTERDRALLESGGGAASKHLGDLEHELQTLARRQRELEDAELELMEALEDAESRLAAVSQRLVAAEDALVEATGAQDEALAGIEAEHAALQRRREEFVSGLPAELLGLYDRIRADGNPVAAAFVRAGRCEACQMQLSSVDLSEIRSAAVDEVLRCPECRSIVVRADASGSA